MSATDRVSVSRRIPASAHDIFQVISDPRGHVKIDGSGTLVAAQDPKPLQGVGDTFGMDMDREALGDIPLGKYQVLNVVTKIAPDSELEWTVGTRETKPVGHVFGYQLAPVSDSETDVTLYCDWSAVSQKWRDRIPFPVIRAEMLTKSLEKLDHVVSQPNT